MKIFKSGKSTVKQPGNSSPSHLTPPLSPPPASPQVSTEWSLGPGETKMAADDGGWRWWRLCSTSNWIRECARILQERGLVFQFSGLVTCGSFNCDEKKVLYFQQKGSSLCTIKPKHWSCTAWRILIKVQVRCYGLSLQGHFRAVTVVVKREIIFVL